MKYSLIKAPRCPLCVLSKYLKGFRENQAIFSRLFLKERNRECRIAPIHVTNVVNPAILHAIAPVVIVGIVVVAVEAAAEVRLAFKFCV